MTNPVNVDEERIARKQAYVDWLTHQHAEEVSAAAAAFLYGKAVRLAYDPKTQRVVATPVEERER